MFPFNFQYLTHNTDPSGTKDAINLSNASYLRQYSHKARFILVSTQFIESLVCSHSMRRGAFKHAD